MLKTRFRIKIPLKLGEIRHSTLYSRCSKKNRTKKKIDKKYPKKSHKMDAQNSARNHHPVQTGRDTRFCTNIKIKYQVQQARFRMNMYVQRYCRYVLIRAAVVLHTCNAVSNQVQQQQGKTSHARCPLCEEARMYQVWDDADQSTTTQSSTSKPRKKASRPGTHAPEGEEVTCEMPALQTNV